MRAGVISSQLARDGSKRTWALIQMCLAPCGGTCVQAGRVFYTFETSAGTAKEAFLVVWRGDADPSLLFRAS